MSTLRCLLFSLKVHIIILKIKFWGEPMREADLNGIGKRIHDRRRQLGYTQEQLADMMNVSIQMVSNLERGNKAIRIDNLINLSQILDVSTDYILTGKQTADDIQLLTNHISQLHDQDRKMIEMLVEYCISQKS